MRKYLATIARLRVDSDLTDNVSATIRLINERTWNGDYTSSPYSSQNIGLTNSVTNEKHIDLDLAYVTMREFLYSPLTLMVGRQELHFGNDFIIGDPDTNMVSLISALPDSDLSARKAFDAIRATLDYNPLILDIVFAKVVENDVDLNDDTTLYGLNAAYDINPSNLLEIFYFGKYRGSNATAATNVDAGNATSFGDASIIKQKADTVNTIGARLVNRSVKNLVIDAQSAFQFGTYNPKFDPNARYVGAADLRETAPRKAWAAEVIATYYLSDIEKIAQYDPSISGVYVYLSGADRDQVGKGFYNGWDPMYENQTLGSIINGIMGFSNAHLTGLTLRARPWEDVGVKVDCVAGWFDKRYPMNRLAILSGVSTAKQFLMGKEPFIGQEYDLTVTYDYTEDVQFSVLSGIFLPGKCLNGDIDNSYPSDLRAAAVECIGSMKVTF
jgi:hypothetical protein